MEVTTYHHLIKRVSYPAENGYRRERFPLADYMHLTITDDVDGDSKYLTFHSRIHINKAVVIQPHYSRAFSDHAIIEDLSGKISGMFL
jgi:hypothetical protein